MRFLSPLLLCLLIHLFLFFPNLTAALFTALSRASALEFGPRALEKPLHGAASVLGRTAGGAFFISGGGREGIKSPSGTFGKKWSRGLSFLS